MPAFRYRPTLSPEWLAVVAPGCLLAVRLDPASERIEPLVSLARGGSTVQGLLDALTSGGLTNTPPFVLAFWLPGRLAAEGVGVVARGDGRALVATAAGDEIVEARGFTTWAERHIDGATAITVELAEPGAPVVDLEIDGGAVWVSRITATDTDEAPAPRHGAGTSADAAAVPAESPAESLEESPEDDDSVDDAPESIDDEGSQDEGSRDERSLGDGSLDDDPIDGHTIARPSRAVLAARAAAAEADGQTPPAPPLPPVPSGTGSALPADTLGDHDGLTVLAEDLRAARQGAHVPTDAPTQSFAVQRYELELPSGARQPLDAPVVLGRAPSVAGVPASALPHLVTLTGDDISRNHVRVAVEGGTVVVTDLHSSNGTIVVVPGRAPEKLRGGEPTPVIAGTLIDLGGGVTMRVRGA